MVAKKYETKEIKTENTEKTVEKSVETNYYFFKTNTLHNNQIYQAWKMYPLSDQEKETLKDNIQQGTVIKNCGCNK